MSVEQMINKNIIKIVTSYINSIKEYGIPIQSAYIFGSYTKGLADKHSDIDVCIVSNRFGKDRQKERVMLMNIRNDDSDLIEPHPFSPEDFRNKFDPLSYQIKKSGLQIV